MSVDQEGNSKKCLRVEVHLWLADSTEDRKKKKKRKRDGKEEETIIPEVLEAPSTSESKKERKEKKKRRKMESAAENITTAELSSSPSKTSPNLQISSTPSAAEAAAFLVKHSITIHTPPNVPEVTPIINFSQLDIPLDLRSSFDGFKEPTPIQACTWPPALDGRDVVGIAETGRYHTLNFTPLTSFTCDVVEKLLRSEFQRCLV